MTASAQSPKHAAALEWGRLGYFVFPVKEGDKTPLVKDWETVATTDPKQITDWWERWPDANIGTAPSRRECMVIDLDVKNGKNGIDELRLLETLYGELPETLAIHTPSGGAHLWFRVNGRGLPSSSVERIARGVDVRAAGGYVLLPPSTVNGNAYFVEADAKIAEVPIWLLGMAKNVSKGERATAPANVELDTATNISRAVEFLKRAPPAIEGEGGDARTVQTAMRLRDLGVGEDAALELLEDHYNPRCEPPWDKDELATKVHNGYQYAQNEAGAFAVAPPQDTFAEYLKSQPKVASGPTRFSDVLARIVPPVQEIVPGLIEKGTVTFLSAPGGSHKSRVALQWGLSIEAGAPIYGRAVQQSRFVYLSYEDHADEVARRAQALAKRLGLPRSNNGEFWDMSGKDAPLAIVDENKGLQVAPFGETFIAHLKSIQGPKFVVIDSTYNALRFVGAAKINEGAVMAGIGFLQSICDKADATLLVLWHPSQAGQERGDASGWSVAWHNAPRARLSITPVKDLADTFTLKVEKRNHSGRGEPITLHWSAGALLPRAETDEAERNTLVMNAVVRAAEGAATSGQPIQMQRRLAGWMLQEIEEAAGYRPPERDVKELLKLAVRQGRLRYLNGTNRRTAGYYPLDIEAATGLATAAKRHALEDASA